MSRSKASSVPYRFSATCLTSVSAPTAATCKSCASISSGKGGCSSHHNGEPLGGARHAGIEPALAAFLKRKAFVEQHHVVPLRALRLVHGEHIAIVEFVVR